MKSRKVCSHECLSEFVAAILLLEPDATFFMGLGFYMQDDKEITDIHFTDAPLSVNWQPRRCHLFDKGRLVEGDFPSLSNYNEIPVMSEPAWIALRPLIGDFCEALPIVYPSKQRFYIVHVIKTIDCLDTNTTEVSHSGPPYDRINRIYRYAFKKGKLRGQHLFSFCLFCLAWGSGK